MFMWLLGPLYSWLYQSFMTLNTKSLGSLVVQYVLGDARCASSYVRWRAVCFVIDSKSGPQISPQCLACVGED